MALSGAVGGWWRVVRPRRPPPGPPTTTARRFAALTRPRHGAVPALTASDTGAGPDADRGRRQPPSGGLLVVTSLADRRCADAGVAADVEWQLGREASCCRVHHVVLHVRRDPSGCGCFSQPPLSPRRPADCSLSRTHRKPLCQVIWWSRLPLSWSLVHPLLPPPRNFPPLNPQSCTPKCSSTSCRAAPVCPSA